MHSTSTPVNFTVDYMNSVPGSVNVNGLLPGSALIYPDSGSFQYYIRLENGRIIGDKLIDIISPEDLAILQAFKSIFSSAPGLSHLETLPLTIKSICEILRKKAYLLQNHQEIRLISHQYQPVPADEWLAVRSELNLVKKIRLLEEAYLEKQRLEPEDFGQVIVEVELSLARKKADRRVLWNQVAGIFGIAALNANTRELLVIFELKKRLLFLQKNPSWIEAFAFKRRDDWLNGHDEYANPEWLTQAKIEYGSQFNSTARIRIP